MYYMKDIPGYEGLYSIDKTGKVYSHLRRKYLSGKIGRKDRYPMVILRKDGKNIAYRVHRLVALTYLRNPDNKPEVNHIDHNKHNNNLENLEWVTHAENMQQSVQRPTFKRYRKPIPEGTVLTTRSFTYSGYVLP